MSEADLPQGQIDTAGWLCPRLRVQAVGAFSDPDSRPVDRDWHKSSGHVDPKIELQNPGEHKHQGQSPDSRLLKKSHASGQARGQAFSGTCASSERVNEWASTQAGSGYAARSAIRSARSSSEWKTARFPFSA